MRSRNGAKVMSTSDMSLPKKNGPPERVSASSTRAATRSKATRYPPSFCRLVSHCSHVPKSVRSSLKSSSDVLRSALPAGGSSGPGNDASSRDAMVALSVYSFPSSTRAGSRPDGTFARNEAGLSP